MIFPLEYLAISFPWVAHIRGRIAGDPPAPSTTVSAFFYIIILYVHKLFDDFCS